MESNQSYLAILITVFTFFLQLQAVTVNPCPTNKVAPRRTISSWEHDRPQPRTLGAFYDLLVPNQQYVPAGSLQEVPQKDDLDDCGDIEDYDENDLSSQITPIRRQSEQSRWFFGGIFNNRPQYDKPGSQGQQQGQHGQQQGQHGQQQGQHGQQQGQHGQQQGQYGQQQGQHGQQQGQLAQIPVRPFRPQKPNYPPTRPPYSSGGYFSNNPYRPPSHQYPSDNIKPVQEGQFQEPQMTYRPQVVGGPIGHVVGVSPVRPTRRPAPDSSYQRQPIDDSPARPTRAPAYDYTTRRPRSRNFNSNDSVLGSFFDLLFK